MMNAPRRLLLDLWAAGIAAVDGRAAVRRHLERSPIAGRCRVIAVGKAAAAMALGAGDALGDRVSDALVITKDGHAPLGLAASLPHLELHTAAHPRPDHRSLQAGEAILRSVDTVPADSTLLFLISGGASSLADVLAPGVTLEQLIAANDWLLGSGLPITDVNAVRGRLSQLKAGRLAARLSGRRVCALLISDVPNDDPAVIGSGMLAASEPGPLPATLPHDWRAWLARLPAPPAGVAGGIELAVVAGPDDLRDAASSAGRARGYRVATWPRRFDGDALEVAREIAQDLRTSTAELIVAVGESTVRLPRSPGRGGRNQHLALEVARLLDTGPRATLLAAGSDGTDGPTDDAGAIVDHDTIARGREAGLDATDALAHAAAGDFLQASGDLLNCGPTGTNVGDVLIGVTARGQRAMERREPPAANGPR